MGSGLAGLDVSDAVDSVAHIIQVALTPVFLLSGIGTLLNVFNTRLSRVSDHREHVEEMLRGDNGDDSMTRPVLRAHLRRLRHRTLVLDVAVVMGAIGGACTCGAAFVLFLGSMRHLDRVLAVPAVRAGAGLHRSGAGCVPGGQPAGLARGAPGRIAAAAEVRAGSA
jgi:hypothetical protein